MRDASRQGKRDRGVALALLMRMENERLPFALQLKKKVERGEVLSEYDLRFLKDALKDSGDVRRLAQKLPEYKELIERMTALYDEITRKGLENQKQADAKTRPLSGYH